MANEVDLASNTQLVEHRSEGVDPGAALQGGHRGTHVQVRNRARRVRWSGRGAARQAVNEVEDTDGKDQDERTEKETDVQMQIADEQIEASHQKELAVLSNVIT